MSSGEPALLEQLLNWVLKAQKPDRIGNRRAIFARALGNLLLCQVELIHQAFKGPSLLDRIEIFSLKIFDQRHLKRHLVMDIAKDCRNPVYPRSLRGPPASLTRNQLVAPAHFAHHQRLHDSASPNRP